MNKRAILAKNARIEARKCFHGNLIGVKSNILPIAHLFPKWPLENWDNKWCAAFVYYCCIKSGFNIPVKFPSDKVDLNFAACSAWEQWAKLPINNFYHSASSDDFIAKEGDIVLYDNVFCNSPNDHIGIIVENKVSSIAVAEGNLNNVSGVIEREKNENIRGYIRIPNNYSYD